MQAVSGDRAEIQQSSDLDRGHMSASASLVVNSTIAEDHIIALRCGVVGPKEYRDESRQGFSVGGSGRERGGQKAIHDSEAKGAGIAPKAAVENVRSAERRRHLHLYLRVLQ